jgi:large subunit ribosomal protein L21
MEAVIATGGKQYRVTPGQVISIEKLPVTGKGSEVSFTSVLLVNQDGKLTTGAGDLQNARVSGQIVAEGLAKKIKVVKFKRRKNYRRTRGHRQPFTQVRITSIEV